MFNIIKKATLSIIYMAYRKQEYLKITTIKCIYTRKAELF